MSTGKIQCPTCSARFNPAESTAMPFCTERCRTIDLGNWLSEEYGVPWERREDEQDDVQSESHADPHLG